MAVLVGTLLKGKGGKSTWILCYGLVEKDDEEVEKGVDLKKSRGLSPSSEGRKRWEEV
jgi:hypothetical protein